MFRICCENCRPMSLKVRLPGHVKWPHLIKRLNARHSYAKWTIALKLSAIVTSNSIYKMFYSPIPEFWYSWFKTRSILWPPHYKSMGENWKAPLLDENHSKHSQMSSYRNSWNPELENLDQKPLLMFPRSFQVMKGLQQFSAITLIDKIKHLRCAQADDTDRVMSNITFSDQVMTLILTLT